MPKTLSEIQAEIKEWSAKNFGSDNPASWKLLGIVEEVGELSHSELKSLQNIRGSKEVHEEEGKDAVGDILIYLLDFCSRKEWDAGELLNKTWEKVKQRDWKKDPEHGGTTTA